MAGDDLVVVETEDCCVIVGHDIAALKRCMMTSIRCKVLQELDHNVTTNDFG
jgi:hypothetical protein